MLNMKERTVSRMRIQLESTNSCLFTIILWSKSTLKKNLLHYTNTLANINSDFWK